MMGCTALRGRFHDIEEGKYGEIAGSSRLMKDASVPVLV
jgi:hypothetical protein